MKFGCTVEQDSDGDFVICPPSHIKIFSEPGEGVLLRADTYEAALIEAEEYLSVITEDEAIGEPPRITLTPGWSKAWGGQTV